MSEALFDPATGEPVGAWVAQDAAEVHARLSAAHAASHAWAEVPLARRVERVASLAPLIRARAAAWAETMAAEVGKPIEQARAEVEKCAWACEITAARGAAWLVEEAVAAAGLARVQRAPLGLVLAIMPWNFPMWQLVRFAAPALIAGNGFLTKHARQVPRCDALLEALWSEAGFPAGLGASVRVADADVASVIADPRVAAVTLTGSTRAGRSVAAAAGQALKPCVLELGGSDPFIVLSDADVDEAARVGALARLQNNGQSCIAAKRFIVAEAVAARFLEAFEARLSAAVVGAPLDPATAVGPLARRDLREALHAQVVASTRAGAKLRLGGAPLAGPGWFYPPTLLTDCGPGMPVWDEETFGPVAAVRVVPTDEAAIEAAAHPIYGLGASLWTTPERGVALAGRLRAGAVFINGMTRSDPRVPFGGVDASGFGRELGRDGIRAFTFAKAVWTPA